MIIENEFTVAAELGTVWRELLDMEGVATCLPGATITATDQENVYHGSMRLKVGPMRVEYRGTATLTEVDEQTHTAVISLSAREAKGQGFARATIRNQLQSTERGTRVSAQTELQITGPQAQFGRGVIEDVGKRVLGEFARCLEQKIGGQVDGTGAAAGGEEDAAGGPSGTVEETAGVAPGETTGAGVGATGPGVVPPGDKLAEDRTPATPGVGATGPGVVPPGDKPAEDRTPATPGVGATGPGVVPGDKPAEDRTPATPGVGATGPGVAPPQEPGVVTPGPAEEPGAAGAYSGAATPSGATEIVPATTNKPVADELDVGSLIWSSPPARRAAAIALGLLVLLMMLLRRRRGGSGR